MSGPDIQIGRPSINGLQGEVARRSPSFEHCSLRISIMSNVQAKSLGRSTIAAGDVPSVAAGPAACPKEALSVSDSQASKYRRVRRSSKSSLIGGGRTRDRTPTSGQPCCPKPPSLPCRLNPCAPSDDEALRQREPGPPHHLPARAQRRACRPPQGAASPPYRSLSCYRKPFAVSRLLQPAPTARRRFAA